MAAIDVAQSPRRLVVIGKQKRGIGTVAGIVIEQAVHRPEQRLGLIEGQRRLAAQAGLQVRYQQSCGDALAGNIPPLDRIAPVFGKAPGPPSR